MTRHLRFFLIGSAILHGLSLAAWRPAEWFGGYPETVLSVSVTAPEAGARATRAELQARSAAGAVVSPRRISPAQHIEAPAPAAPSWTLAAAEPPSHSSATPTAEASGMGGPEQARARIRSRLLGDIARHFHYPLLARQRGWEGTVLLGLRVESDGHLEKIRIERSSGYAVLDHSALNSLHRLGQVAGISAWLNGRSVDMQLPIIYRLVED